MYDTRYVIKDINIGVAPWTMEKELRDFLVTNSSPCTNVKWARYGKAAGVTRKQNVLDEIERMLNDDIPVVFSYHSMAEDKIVMYNNIQDAKELKDDSNIDGLATSHYMTITGLYKYPGEQPWSYKYILEAVSWGKVYYIDYDSYAKKLDYFSNILSVY